MRREADREGNSSPYSQHSKLLEPSEVILMDPSDIVAIELSGRERGKGTGEMGALDPWGSAQTPLHLAQLRLLTLPAKKSNRPKPLCSPHSSSSKHVTVNMAHCWRLQKPSNMTPLLGLSLDKAVSHRGENLEIGHG